MADENIILGFTIGLIAYIVLYIGKGIQKYAIEGFKEEKTIKSKHTGIWTAGLIMTTAYMFVQWAALAFAPINLIAPLEGVGLIILLIFSYYILKEDINKIEIAGVFLIIGGTVIITMLNPNTGQLNPSDFNLVLFLSFCLPITVIEGVTILISKFKGWKYAGLIIGVTAGTLNAFQTFSKRVTLIPEFTFIFTMLTFLFSIFTLLATQFGFTKANANVIVPCFTSASIILATITGVMALNELIEAIQILGIILIIIGIICLTAFKKKDDTPQEKEKEL